MEISNLFNKGLKVIIIKILTELDGRMDECGKNFNKAIENIKKNQTQIKNTLTGIKKKKNTIRNQQQIR